MNRAIMKWISWSSLVALIMLPVLFLFNRMTLDAVKWGLMVTTGIWFVTASTWMLDETK